LSLRGNDPGALRGIPLRTLLRPGGRDDLKLISGVGPKLEKLLNENGVYYFWQVASWNRDDIKIIDDRLDVFKGRISRDEWVKQAKNLKRQPHASPMPEDI
jgi:predicted flap endonuclease-1-like 5' DNA nuclease